MAIALYTINEMTARYQTTLRTLRFYEQENLLSPTRVAGRRMYTAADRIRFELILKGKRLGFTLSEIRKLIDGMATTEKSCQDADLLAHLGGHEIVRRIADLQDRREELQSSIDELKRAQQRQTSLIKRSI